MRLNYQQLNELYALLTENFHPEMKSDEEFLNKIAATINLIDECNQRERAEIYIRRKDKDVKLFFRFNDEWPKFLIDWINNGRVKLYRTKGDKTEVFVKP